MQHLWAQSQSSFIDLFPVKWNRNFSLFAALWSLFFCRSLFWVLFKPSVLSLEQQSCMVWRYCCICCHLMGEYSLGASTPYIYVADTNVSVVLGLCRKSSNSCMQCEQREKVICCRTSAHGQFGTVTVQSGTITEPVKGAHLGWSGWNGASLITDQTGKVCFMLF